MLEVQLVEGVKRYWLNASKRGETDAPDGVAVDLSPEETERARQRNLARQPAPGGLSAYGRAAQGNRCRLKMLSACYNLRFSRVAPM